MKSFSLILLLLSLLSADYGGGYAGSEFRYPSNARDIALAGANIADGSEGYYQFSNPAQLPQLKSLGISSSFMSLPLDRSIQILSISKPLPPFAGIALSIYRSATSDIVGRDLMNKFTENLNVSNYMGMLSFGLAPSKKVALGLNVKTYLIKFVHDHSANGIGIDFGLRLTPIDKLVFALKLENMSAEMNWKVDVDDEQRQSVESFPLNLVVGCAYQFSKAKVYLQQEIMNGDDGEKFYRTRIGSEILFGPLTVQWGSYQNRGEFTNETSDDFNFVSTGGFGVTMKDNWNIPLQLNYAFDTGRAGEGVGHMFTLNCRFNETD
ncbi:MAG: hypothetical protein HOM61_05115 [Candidatus Marinimicrobia bacterium]|nr:hypothetical protein [Candidatus Neomarinimicrobiota bacterium]MBT5956025.1 hypothetical protein [Candidatus Neomarinimicrobiota bacterium]MBT6870988.1 hypothetical protein [Candidatus Neomarinimicrobiota bacterium]